MGAKYYIIYHTYRAKAASDLRGGFFGGVRCKVGGRTEASAPTILSPSFRRLLPYFPLDNGQKIGII